MKPWARMGATALAVLALAGCVGADANAPAKPWVASADLSERNPGIAPERASREGGLWETLNKVEEGLRQSGELVRDPALNAYVGGVVCKLAGSHCGDIRVYVLDRADFNASMYPNGMMTVWTGTLLRVRDEAQLAAVLGHEIGHYLLRHSVKAMENRIEQTNVQTVGYILLGLAKAKTDQFQQWDESVAGAMAAFSRDNEREADDFGLRLLVENGYSAGAAADVWGNMIAESRAEGRGWMGNTVLASHPAAGERLVTMARMAADASSRGLTKDGKSGVERFRAAVLPHRGAFLRAELNRRRPERSLAIIDTLIADGANLGELLFFKGEILRQRGRDDDPALAMAAYQAAATASGAPPELYRALGLAQLKAGQNAAAAQSFDQFLTLRPDAPDRDMIRMAMEQAKGANP